jgi:LysM repeat protein
MIPFVSIDALYRTGLAGAFTLIPFLALGATLLYKLVMHFTKNRAMGISASLLFALNPYVLYYSATPMMEMLYISLLITTAYCLVKWSSTGRFTYLFATALAVAFTSIARFEGLILIPIVTFFIIAKLLLQRKSYSHIEAVVILFLFVGVLGAVGILSYGWVFGNNPLAFMNSDWSAASQQADYLLPTKGNIAGSFDYLIHAAYYILGRPQVLATAGAVIILFLLLPSFDLAAAGIVLISPLLFDAFALTRGNILLYVWELPPFNWFYNMRYGLYWVGFSSFIPAVLGGALIRKIGQIRVKKILTGFFSAGFAAIALLFLFRVSFQEKFAVVYAERYPWEGLEMDLTKELERNYDSGQILITRAQNDFVTVNAGIPLKNFIQESNYKYYDQALARPWLFARWVIMYNPQGTDLIPYWAKRNEKVSVEWGDSKAFRDYYKLVYQNQLERLYVINEEAVRKYGEERNFATDQIPSINPGVIGKWDPDTVYAKMNAENYRYSFDQNEKEVVREVSNISEPVPPPQPEARFITASSSQISGNVRPKNENKDRKKYMVRKGDTLWSISLQKYGVPFYWKRIADANGIKDPYFVSEGESLYIP